MELMSSVAAAGGVSAAITVPVEVSRDVTQVTSLTQPASLVSSPRSKDVGSAPIAGSETDSAGECKASATQAAVESSQSGKELIAVMEDGAGPSQTALVLNQSGGSDVRQSMTAQQSVVHDVMITEDGAGVNLITEDVKTVLRCEQCEYSTPNKYNLKQHVDLVHAAERPFKCPFCDYAGKRSYSLKQHLVLHSNDLPYQCVHCKASFRKKGHLTNHVKMHAASKVFLCAICEKQLENEENLFAHLREHSADEVYACESCEYATTDSSSIVLHMHLHGNPTLFRCGQCDFTGLHKLSMEQHMKSHTPDASYTVEKSTVDPKPVFLLKCSVCGYTTDTNAKLKSHLTTHSLLNANLSQPSSAASSLGSTGAYSSSETLYKCLNCHFSCQEASLFMKHMMQHGHNAQSPALESSSSGDKQGSFTYDAAASLYRCNICSYKCEHQRTIKGHMWKHTGHQDVDYPMFINGPTSVFDDTPFVKSVATSHRGAKDFPVKRLAGVNVSPAAASVVDSSKVIAAPMEGLVLVKAPLPPVSPALLVQPQVAPRSTSQTNDISVNQSNASVAVAPSQETKATTLVTSVKQESMVTSVKQEGIPTSSVKSDDSVSSQPQDNPLVNTDTLPSPPPDTCEQAPAAADVSPPNKAHTQAEVDQQDGKTDGQPVEVPQIEKESSVPSHHPSASGEGKEVRLQIRKLNEETKEYELQEIMGQLMRTEDGTEVLVVTMDKDNASHAMPAVDDTVEVIIEEEHLDGAAADGSPSAGVFQVLEDVGHEADDAQLCYDVEVKPVDATGSPSTAEPAASINESQTVNRTGNKRPAPTSNDVVPAKRSYEGNPCGSHSVPADSVKNVVVEKLSQVYTAGQIGLAASADVGLQTMAPESESCTSTLTQHAQHILESADNSREDLNEKMDSDEENREVVVNENMAATESGPNVWSNLRHQSPGKTSTREELTALLALLKKGPHFSATKPHGDSHGQNRESSPIAGVNPSKTQIQSKSKGKTSAKVKPLSEAQSSPDHTNISKPKSGICSSLLAVIEQLRERSKSESDTDESPELGKITAGKKVVTRSQPDHDAGIENHPNIERWGSQEEGVQFRCRLCHYASGNGWLMMSHMSIHKEKKPSECSLCDYSAISSEDLQDHMLQHCKVRTYQCKLCPSVFHYKSQLRAHMRAHDTGPFTCRMCSYETDNPIVYRQHLQTHSEQQPTKQDALQTRLATSSLVSLAQPSAASSERIFHCSQCESLFVSKDDLYEHSLHSGCLAPSKDNYSEQFKCDACSFITSDIEKMKSHLSSHNKSCKFGRRYQCTKCEFACHSHNSFKKHCRSHPDDMPIKCEFCDFSALSLRSLKSHMKRHANDQKFVQQPLEQYKCNMCGYVCHHLPSLKSHMWRHASDQNYSYEQTNDVINAAIDYDMVTGGVDTHPTGKPAESPDEACFVTFRCCQCGFESLNKALLNDHMKAHMDIIKKTFEVIKTPINGASNRSNTVPAHPVIIKEECIETSH